MSNPALTDLRYAFSLEGDARHRLIKDVAHRLHMPKMARFVEQMATPTLEPRAPEAAQGEQT